MNDMMSVGMNRNVMVQCYSSFLMVDDFECFEFNYFLEIVNYILGIVIAKRVRTLLVVHAIGDEPFVDNKYEVVHGISLV
jgi:hypothetical protein